MEPELVLRLGRDLLEGPVWDDARDILHFVDIPSGAIFSWSRRTRELDSVTVGQAVGAVVLRANGGMVAAVRDGIAAVDPSGALTWIAPIEKDVPDNLMNDAKCDPLGRLWAGTLADDEREGAGALYRIDADHSWQAQLTGTTVSNGMAWDSDGKVMYYVDSATRGVDAFDFDVESGTISGRRRVVEIDEGEGVVPDGLTIDADGFLWVAVWGGGAVRRYSPSGALDGEIRLPVSQVTSCAFGGPSLDELYVTTAALGLTAEAREREPLAGSLFRCRPGVVGLPAERFAG